MKRLMIPLFVFTIILSAQTEQIKSFDELFEILTTGSDVSVVIRYAETDLIVDGKTEEAPEAIGGMEFSTYEYFAVGTVRNEKAYFSTSETVLIGHPFYGYVLNYVKLRVYDDNSVEISAQYLDPKTYEVKMDEKFVGKINDSENNGGVYFYKD